MEYRVRIHRRVVNLIRGWSLPDEIQADELEIMAGQYEQLEQLRQKIENRREDAARRGRPSK